MRLLLGSLFLLMMLVRCSTQNGVADEPDPNTSSSTVAAEVLAVSATGATGSYSFSVTVKSPDTGCDQYADWWEVLSEEGVLLYRRVLTHSHVDEQPFTRTGGPVPAAADQVVIIRAHMNNTGYGAPAMRGSVESGFTKTTQDEDFAADVARQEPLPTSCAF